MSRKLVCDFCSWPEPKQLFVCPASSYQTGIPAGPPNTTIASYGGWLACEVCVEFVRRADRRALARHGARMLRRKMMPGERARVSLNMLERVLEGTHSEFWRNREGEPREMTEEDRAEFLAMPESFVTQMPGSAPVKPRWLTDLEREAQG